MDLTNRNLLHAKYHATFNTAHGGRYDIERRVQTAMRKSSEFVENGSLLDEKKNYRHTDNARTRHREFVVSIVTISRH